MTRSAATMPNPRCGRSPGTAASLVIGFAAGSIPRVPLNLALLKNCRIVGVVWGSWADRNPELNRRNVDELLALYAAGKIRPEVSEHFPPGARPAMRWNSPSPAARPWARSW